MPKVTKRGMFSRIAYMAEEHGDTEIYDFAMREIELLNRKSKAPKGMTAKQFANGLIKADILNRLEEAEGLRAGQIAEIMGISNQKATALLAQLVKDGFAKREKIGKVTKFYAV